MADVSEPLNDHMKKIAHGTGVALIGTFLALLFGFITRLIIARYGSEAEYGVYSLAIVIITFAIMLASLALPEGIARYIAYFRGKDEAVKIRGVISVALQLATVASIILGTALFLSADAIALNIFHIPDLALALKIFAIGIPFFTLINILVSIFRGFDRMEPQAYFQYALFNILFLLLVLASTMLHLPFVAIFYTYVIALILTFVALLLYTIKRLPQPITFGGAQAAAIVRKELVVFSTPLLVTVMLSSIIFWLDSLLLGYFKTPESVGLYNAARPMAQFVAEPLSLMLLIYTPVATGLYSQNLVIELRRSYTISTKWIVSLTLPFFLVLCLFPEAVLNLFFGPAYTAAAPALCILSIGFIINNLFGPNQSILLAMGQSRFIMWAALAAAIVSVLLNVVLIPPLGIVGAAIAMVVSVVISKVIVAAKAFSLCRSQPLSKNLLKPMVTSVLLAFLFWFATHGLVDISWWMLALLFVLYYAIYAVAVVLTRSFDNEDIAMLLELEKRSGINAAPIKKILARFVR